MAGTEQANRSVFLLLCNATGKCAAHAQWIADQWLEIVIESDGISDLLLKSKGATFYFNDGFPYPLYFTFFNA